ncbi:MAG: hypothetical protein AAF372_00190 [Pseudomonadota bacterium]
MFRKLFYSLVLTSSLLCSITFANDDTGPRSVEITSSEEFNFVGQNTAIFTIRPLKESLRSVENLKDTEAVGIVYLGRITLGEKANTLSVLRDISVQISKGLDIDLALITDSATSESLAPHEMLLLYHPQLAITLALTQIPETEEYSLMGTYAIPVVTKTVEVAAAPEQTDSD